MPIDPRIALGVQPVQIPLPDPNSGLNALAKALQIKDLQSNSELNALKIDEYKRKIEDDQALRESLAAPGADPYKVLLQRGRVTDAGAFLKSQNEAEKAKREGVKMELETSLKRAEHISSILTNARDPQSYGVVRNVIKGQFGVDMPEQFDPAYVQARIAEGQTITQRLAAEHQRLTLEETGRHNRVTETETGRHNRASEGIQVRGQNMVDARAKEANSLTREANATVYDTERGILVNKGTGVSRPAVMNGQPVGVKDKALTEGQAKANLFGTRMQEADKVLSQMAAAGVKRPGVIKGVAESVGNIMGLGTESMGGALSDAAGSLTNWTQSAEQQQVEQAQRDFINAVLRRESGAVISPGEFRNANKQYFPQPNDDEATLALKARNRQIAIDGILAEVPENKRTKPSKPTSPEGAWDSDKERRYQEWKARQGK